MSDIISDVKKRMEGAANSFDNDLKGVRTGRASASMLDNVVVDVYGSKMPINQVANVNVPEARLITVQVWDANNVAATEKAINNSNLGLNPSSEGSLIRLPIPDLSEERRKELVKIASGYAENSKVAVRNVRRDGIDKLKTKEKNSEISQDDLHSLSDQIQQLTDKFVKKIDEALVIKEKDIMAV